MNFNPIYKIIFSHNGDIIVDKYYTETETIYLNHIYIIFKKIWIVDQFQKNVFAKIIFNLYSE